MRLNKRANYMRTNTELKQTIVRLQTQLQQRNKEIELLKSKLKEGENENAK